MKRHAKFEELSGETITNIHGLERGSERVRFLCASGKEYTELVEDAPQEQTAPAAAKPKYQEGTVFRSEDGVSFALEAWHAADRKYEDSDGDFHTEVALDALAADSQWTVELPAESNPPEIPESSPATESSDLSWCSTCGCGAEDRSGRPVYAHLETCPAKEPIVPRHTCAANCGAPPHPRGYFTWNGAEFCSAACMSKPTPQPRDPRAVAMEKRGWKAPHFSESQISGGFFHKSERYARKWAALKTAEPLPGNDPGGFCPHRASRERAERELAARRRQ